VPPDTDIDTQLKIHVLMSCLVCPSVPTISIIVVSIYIVM
jgi:hypothetical protein